MFFKFFNWLQREEGWEREIEISVMIENQLPPACLPTGSWVCILGCALTRTQTMTSWLMGPQLNHWDTVAGLWNTIFTWVIDRRPMVIQIWVFGRHFIKKRKNRYYLLPIIKFELDNSPFFKDFSDEVKGNINKYEFLILNNEIYQHFEEPHKSVN